MGPILSASSGDTSTKMCKILLNNETPAIPDLNLGLIDVRDTAAAHIAAMEKPEAAGNRYILTMDETVSLKNIAEALREEFEPQGYKIPKKGLPKAVAWIGKFFSSDMKLLYPCLGVQLTWNNAKMKGELGIQPRSLKQAVVDMGYSLIEFNIVPKKSGYLGHPSTLTTPPKDGETAEDGVN